MNKQVVAIVEPFSSAALLPNALREAGYSPVGVVNQYDHDFDIMHPTLELPDFDFVMNHHGNIDETIDRLRLLSPVAIIPGMEGSLRLAQSLADALAPDTANVSELVDARRNKYFMHQALAAAGMPIVKQVYTGDPAEVQAWIDREGLAGHDLVIKPATSAATVGINLAPGGEGWQEIFAGMVGVKDKSSMMNERILVMELMTGTEFAVDTVSHDGRHCVTDLLRYRRVRLGKGMAVYDSVEWLPYDLDAFGDILDYGLAALDAVGLRHWAAHTEIMMTENGPRLVEVNARLAGAGNPNVTLMATGHSQVTRMIDVVCGRGPQLPAGFTLHRPVMAVFLMAHSDGVVRNAEIFDKVKDLPSYHSPVHLVHNGDVVEETTDILTSLSMGYFILAHDNAEQVYADREAIRELEKQLVIEPVA